MSWHLFYLNKNQNHVRVQHKTRHLLCEPSVQLPNIMHVKPAYLLSHDSVKKLFPNFKYLSSSCQAPEGNLNVSSDKHTSSDSTVVIGIPEKQEKNCTCCFLISAPFPNTPLVLPRWLSGYPWVLNKQEGAVTSRLTSNCVCAGRVGRLRMHFLRWLQFQLFTCLMCNLRRAASPASASVFSLVKWN